MAEKKAPKDALEAAIDESKPQTFEVFGKTFEVVNKLTVPVLHRIYKAQREDDLSLLIDAVTKMVVPAQRAAFEEFILDGDADEELGMEEFNDLFQDVLEKVVGRPLEQ